MNTMRMMSWLAPGILCLTMGGCGKSGANAPSSAPSPSYPAHPQSASPALESTPQSEPTAGGAEDEVAAQAPARAEAPSSPPGSASKSSAGRSADMSEGARMRMPAPEARPGLGTAWGETRESRTTNAAFERADYSRPFSVATLWYNDREGANAMARSPDYKNHPRAIGSVFGGALTVSLRSEAGNTLPGFFAGGKQYVVGDVGSRYVINVQNHSSYRFEVVTSVDGLDVIDGRQASFTKRGYLIQPYGSIDIDGFRQSSDAVAAFRFSSVRGSYSSRSGQGDRNVGVIGVAVFNERGIAPVWTNDEVQRRHNADPFPGRYAVPPPN